MSLSKQCRHDVTKNLPQIQKTSQWDRRGNMHHSWNSANQLIFVSNSGCSRSKWKLVKRSVIISIPGVL